MADKINKNKHRLSRVFKRALALFIIVIINFNSFSAVVSSNDGSAFITKAEFDALVNDFNSRIEDYEKSIDAKIDGAIAEYLAGLATTFSEVSRVLVSNYNEMMWVRDYNMYGKWKKWTNNTTMTSNMTDSWFTPSLNEKRHTFRNGYLGIYSPWSYAMANITSYVTISFSSLVNGVALANSTGWASSAETGVPVMIFKIDKDSDGNEFVNGFLNVFTMGSYVVGLDHRITDASFAAYQWNGYAFFPTSVAVVANGSEKDILRLKFTVNRQDAAGNVTSQYYVNDLTTDNTRFPSAWCDDEHNAGGGSTRNKFSTQTQAYNTAITTTNFFSTGCTWHQLSNPGEQKSFLMKMMLGKANSQQVNLDLKTSDGGERQDYDYSKSTSFATIRGKLTDASVMGRYYYANVAAGADNRIKSNLSVDVALTVPHWPTGNLKDLTSKYFMYQGQGLKYGEGFPLRVDNQGAGFMHIKFDSAVKNIIGGAKASNQNLNIDIKKESFLQTANNYATGYLGLVDPLTTTKSKITLNNYTYTTTDGKIELTVPIEAGESLWIRLAPADTTKGLYAEWSNLDMSINSYS